MAEETKPKAARKAAAPRKPKKGPFTRGVQNLMSAKEAFLDIRIRDEEHDLMVPIVRKLEQFLAAIEKKDPGLIDAVDAVPDAPGGGTTEPAMYTEPSVVDKTDTEAVPTP